jgi:hypothetical protein
MKNIILTLVIALVSGVVSFAQNGDLIEDQNPNYMNSMRKYMDSKDDIIATQGTTQQDTYYVFDRYENKLQKKINKQENKHERRLAKINNRGRAIPYNPYLMGGTGFGVTPWMGTGFNSGIGFNRGFNNRYCPPGGFNQFNNFHSPWNRGGAGFGWGW